jgi:CheY-like chemotaxis protein
VSATRTHKGVVFVAEDEAEARAATQELLEHEGYLVLTARDGHEALARMRGIAMPAVAVIDLCMPRMDGWRLIEVMHADEGLRRIPVVVLSAKEPGPIADRVQRVLRKPCRPAELLSHVQELCAG